MKKIAKYKADEDFPARKVSFVAAESLADVPELIRPSDSHFALLIVLDGGKFENELIYAIAEKLLAKGMVYACVWRPDSERVHDIIDQAKWTRNPDETDDNVVMTTWHANETLGQAVSYFLWCTVPQHDYEQSCHDWVAAVIGNPVWEKKVRTKLTAEKRKVLKERNGR